METREQKVMYFSQLDGQCSPGILQRPFSFCSDSSGFSFCLSLLLSAVLDAEVWAGGVHKWAGAGEVMENVAALD